MYQITFELNLLPKAINAQNSMHWAQKGKMVKEIHSLVEKAIGENKPDKPLRRAKLICTRMSSVCPDYDGLVSSWKHVIDGLTECGVIEDDSMKIIGMPNFIWVKAPPKAGKVRITVIEIS